MKFWPLYDPINSKIFKWKPGVSTDFLMTLESRKILIFRKPESKAASSFPNAQIALRKEHLKQSFGEQI